ncbi:intermediate filament protein ON3-like [Clinocottus analis]|uniref:intermediate filament protein ON3-like n=1 Tax=Clinocottus analis TaxID=304258 RepID=UPI0035C08293
MSLRSHQSSRPGQRRPSGGFSSVSLGSYSIPRLSDQAAGPITAVTFNRSLLAPVNIDIDPAVQLVRNQEKEQIKGLNNRFVSFIDKVRFLEQQNKMLETKWTLLEGQTAAASNVEPMLKAYISNLQKQLDVIDGDKRQLDAENGAVHKSVGDYKTMFEKEINKRNEAEMDFVSLKKDVDAGYMSKVDLDDQISFISNESDFYTSLYDEELRELQESLKETSVVVHMDNSRGLNMDHIVSQVKAQYEDIAARSREEAESWHRSKLDQKAAEANQYGDDMRSAKGQISELQRMVSRLQNEIQAVTAQRTHLEGQISQADQRGEGAVRDARARVGDLELALQRAKQDMALQVKEYQELMNLKLALDIEISTYRKLLEGEEERLGHDSVVNVQRVDTKSTKVKNQKLRRKSAILIKTVETHDRMY